MSVCKKATGHNFCTKFYTLSSVSIVSLGTFTVNFCSIPFQVTSSNFVLLLAFSGWRSCGLTFVFTPGIICRKVSSKRRKMITFIWCTTAYSRLVCHWFSWFWPIRINSAVFHRIILKEPQKVRMKVVLRESGIELKIAEIRKGKIWWFFIFSSSRPSCRVFFYDRKRVLCYGRIRWAWQWFLHISFDFAFHVWLSFHRAISFY